MSQFPPTADALRAVQPWPRPPLPLRPLQPLLLLGTFVTMAYSGGTYWDIAPHLLSAAAEFSVLPASLHDAALRCRSGLPFALWLTAILGCHEMGHYVACRRYGIAATWPYFLPAPLFMFGTFGAVIRIRSPIPDRRALFDVALAGPFAGVAVALAALCAGLIGADAIPKPASGEAGVVYALPWIGAWFSELLRPGETLVMNGTLAAAWAGFLITVLNLFPAGQLDGGHLAYAVSKRLHRWVSWAAVALAALSVLRSFRAEQPPVYLVWLLVLLWMRDRHPPLWVERSTLGRSRLALALLAFAVFVISFTWFPIRFVGG